MALVGKPLQVERSTKGQRVTLRDLSYCWRGEVFKVPAGFTTDYSSYPLAFLYFLVPVLIWFFDASPLWGWTLLLIPHWSRVDLAGIFHDWAWRSGAMSFMKANLLWLHIATSGAHRANLAQGVAGFLGLSTFGLVVYEKIKIFGHSLAKKLKK